MEIKGFRLAVFFTFFLFTLSTQCQDFPITQITTSSTNCIFRDNDGFVWFGTQDGLVRYDGNEFRNFRHHRGDPTSIPNNFIWSIRQDKKHRLWVGTFGGGLAMFDKYTERFTPYYSELTGADAIRENTIRAIELVADTMLLIGTEKGIRALNLEQLSFYAGGVWDTLANLNWFIYSLAVTPEGNIFAGTENGLYEIRDLHGELCIQQLPLPIGDPEAIPHVLFHKGVLYAASEYGMLTSNDYLHFEDHTAQHKQKPHRVQQILIDKHDNIWLATLEGLGRFHTTKGYTWYHPKEALARSLKTDNIQCLGEAEEDVVFAGTRLGVHQFSTVPPPFLNIAYLTDSLGCSRTALGMVEDHNGDIWICRREGLMRLSMDVLTGEVSGRCFLTSNTPGMLHDYTISITRDLRNDLWVTYRYGGFSRIRITGDSIEWTQFPKSAGRFSGESVNQVYQDSRRNYWIATSGHGLMRFFPERDSLVNYGAAQGLSHPFISRIYEDCDHHLWIATASGGLCDFDSRLEKFNCYLTDRTNPSSISSNMIHAISEDSEDRLWVCTNDGLNLMDKINGTFTIFTTADGLPSNVIYSAVADRKGDLWISTNEGIVRMQYRDSIPVFDILDQRDGLPGHEFNQHAYLRHSSGMLLMGSTEGVVYWKPQNIQAREYKTSIVLTEFQLDREPVPVGLKDKKTFSLDTNINDIKRIVLRHDQNFLSFKFSALAYDHSKVGSYRFMMEGVDNHWVISGNRRFAAYPDLEPGRYAFKVNVTNSAGLLSGSPKVIEIDILPPPWQSWWAYTLYGIIIVASLYGVLLANVARNKAIERVRDAERDQFRKRLARDFHDEAGNKITLISLLSDRARKKSEDNPEVKEILANMQMYVQDLRAGMRDFIWIMDPSHDSAFDTIVRFRDFADKVCEQAGIQFVETGRNEQLKNVKMTGNVRRHMLLIFKEAMYNSLKHANPDRISFTVRKDSPEEWEFILEDDGLGLNSVRRNEGGHGLENMRARAAQINADIEIAAVNGSGTRVSLKWSPPGNE